jgi:hypothetical protein
MPRMNLLLGLAIFCLRAFLFHLDDVKAELALDEVANLSGLQSESRLLEFRHHLSVAEPAEIAALILASGIS